MDDVVSAQQTDPIFFPKTQRPSRDVTLLGGQKAAPPTTCLTRRLETMKSLVLHKTHIWVFCHVPHRSLSPLASVTRSCDIKTQVCHAAGSFRARQMTWGLGVGPGGLDSKDWALLRIWDALEFEDEQVDTTSMELQGRGDFDETASKQVLYP